MKERRGTGENLPSQPQLLPRTQVPKLDVFGASGWGPQTQLVMPGLGCLGPSLWEGCSLQAVAQLSGEASPHLPPRIPEGGMGGVTPAWRRAQAGPP